MHGTAMPGASRALSHGGFDASLSGGAGRRGARQDACMAQNFGRDSPPPHTARPRTAPPRATSRSSSPAARSSRLYQGTREQVAEFDAGAEEVAQLTARLVPAKLAHQPVWGHVLDGHSTAERRAADAYALIF